MRRVTPFFRLFFTLWMSGVLMGSAWAAEAADEATPIPQPEKENPPVFQVPKKHHRKPNLTRGPRDARVEFGHDVVVGAGEVVPGLVVIAGNATVDGTVKGCLVVISGSAKVNGEVGQDIVSVLGSATLGPQAHIGHDAIVVGGPLRIDPKAMIDGQQTVVGFGEGLPNFMWLQSWVTKGLFLARPFPPQVKWVWVMGGLFLLVYLALVAMFPRPAQACMETLEQKPIASFLLGLLLLVLLLPICLLLLVSIIGIPVIPFVACAFVAALVFGKVAVYSFAGQQLGRQMQISHAALPLLLLLGGVVFYLIYMVPVLGFAVWGIATLLGLGGVFLASLRLFRHEDALAMAPTMAMAPGFMAPAMATPLAAGTSEVPPATAAAAPPLVPPTIASLAQNDVALLPRVGFWKRLGATVLDFLLLCLAIPHAGPAFLILWAAYHIGMWTWKGTTIGGIVFSIKIVRTDGKPVDFAVALVRSLSSFFSAFALFLGFFWAGWDRERQAWHDKIAGTIVVQVPKGISLI